jgi:hypothetical protein
MSAVTRIAIPSPVHLVAAPASDRGRFSFNDVAAFIPPSGPAVLSATDGKCAAFVPADVPDRVSAGRMLLPHSAVKACKRTRKAPMPMLTMNGRAEVPGGASFEVPDQACSYPPVAEVIPADELVKRGNVISLNPSLLLKLAEALGSGESVSLVMDPSGKGPIVVLSDDRDAPKGSVGLLMPRYTDGKSEAIRTDAVERLGKVREVIRTGSKREGGAA